MTMHVKDATVWKTANPKVRDAGVWKQVQKGSVLDGGVWKTFFNNASYSASASPTLGTEPFNVAIALTTTGVANGEAITYLICDEYGMQTWNTSDYTVSSSTNSAPLGVVYVDSSGNASLNVNVVNNELNESTEYFSVKFWPGYYADTSGPHVAQTPVITVYNAAGSCIWALYGRPEWC